MQSPVEPSDNLYEPPASALLDEVAVPSAERTPNGSTVKLGPRRKFTAGRLVWEAVKIFGVFGLHLIFSLGLGLFLMFPYEELGLTVTVFSLLGLFVLLSNFYAGVPLAARLMWSPNFRRETDFYVEMAFMPRLPAARLERVDSADDIGILSLEGDVLRYRGDRIELQLTRLDVTRLCRKRAAMHGFWVIPHLQIDLDHRLLKRTRLWIGIREGFTVWRSLKRSRQMCRALQEWFRTGLGAALDSAEESDRNRG